MTQPTFLCKLVHPYAMYRCVCGVTFAARVHNVKYGHTKSCGCFRRAVRHSVRHGMYGTHVHTIWQSMLQRCTNQKHRSFHNYGGRGITVDPTWLKFENFYSDMGEPPEGLTLDRKNNDLGYSKTNCRWATTKVQGNNKRSNVMLELDSITLNVTQWSERLGVDRMLIFDRLRAGWPAERALTEPKRNRKGG